MGIQINGIDDIISAADGSFTISGADLSNLPNLNVSGVATVTTLSVTNANPVNLNVSGVTTVSAGSTSAPSITPSGDSNTGIFFPAADTIAFAEGGAEALRIDSSGRLGIGTNNPTSVLQINASPVNATGNSEIHGIRINAISSQTAIHLGANGTDGYGWIQAATWGTSFRNLIINPHGGNIGIATTIATSLLTVQGDARIVGVLTATSNIKIGSNTVATTGKAIAMAMVFS